MSGPYTAALEDLRRWRAHVDFLIASLEKLDVGAPALGQSGLVPVAAPELEGWHKPRKSGPKTPAAGRSTRPARVKQDGHESTASDILALVKKAGGSMAPGELAKQLKFTNLARLRFHTAPLLKSKQLVATGSTATRRLALPGVTAKGGL